MSITPAVELRFHPTDLDHTTLREAFKEAAKPSQAIEAALLAARIQVITAAKAQVAEMTGEMTAAKLIGVADFAWQLYMPRFVRALGPVFADQYIRTMRATGAGEIPMSMVYAMADQHVERIGTYFHESSRDALVNGFNTFVNRRMTERVAADRVLDAYGLTARGMAGYAARATDKAATATPMKLKQRVLDYIGTSFRRRSKIFATQEEHNISQQAEQIAWMWLQDKGQLTPAAEKVWITARDERVCSQCGPMHNVRALLTERFTLPNQTKVYVPGVHPNCRCTVKLLDHPWKQETSKRISKAEWDPKEHPRGGDPENPGRFSVRARTTAPRPEPKPVAEAEPEDTREFQRLLDQAAHVLAVEEALGALEAKTHIAQEEKTHISQAEKTHIGEKTDLGTRTSIAETQPKTLVSTEPTTRTEVKVSPTQRLRIHADTAKTFVAYNEENRRRPETPKPTPYEVVPTLRLPYPVFTIANAWDIDPGGYIELTNDTEFFPNGEQAATMAAQDFDENINAVAEDLAYNDGNRITQELDDGTKLIGVVNEDYVIDVVAHAAYQGRSGDNDQIGDADIPVTWHQEDSRGEPGDVVGSESIKASQIAEEWGMEPEQFDVHVLVLEEGHNSELGETVQLNAGTRHGYESWVTTGRYKLEPENRMQIGHSVPITFHRMEPADVTPETKTPTSFGQPPRM
jgi:hypothetical protein